MDNLRTINEFPTYKISVCGSVFSRFGKELKPHLDKNGYYQVQLYKNKKRKTCKIHRLIAQTFLPNFYGKLQVDHKNRNRSDNRLINLKWGTRSEIYENINKSNTTSTNTNHKYIYRAKNKTAALYGIDTDLYSYQLSSIVWRFKILIDKKTHTKTFDTLEEAVAYRDLFCRGLTK